MNLFTKQKQTHQHRTKFMVTKVESRGWKRDKLGVWGYHIHNTIYKIQVNKDQLYNTEYYTQYLVVTYKGK